MPKIGTNKEKMVGFSPQQIKKLMQNKFGFCLDLNHAIKAAISLKKDYKEYIAEFLKLNPKVLHISDGDLRNEEDKHLDIGEGEYDFNFLADYIRKSGSEYITLETPRADLNSLKEDLENLAKLKLFLSF
jgi:deoxyribonuclease-4